MLLMITLHLIKISQKYTIRYIYNVDLKQFIRITLCSLIFFKKLSEKLTQIYIEKITAYTCTCCDLWSIPADKFISISKFCKCEIP